MEKKQILISFIAIFSVIGFVFLATNYTLTPKSLTLTESAGEMSLKYTGVVCVGVNKLAEQGECKKNLFTNLGQNYTRGALTGSYGANFAIDFIGLGNATTAQAETDVVLTSEMANECTLGRAVAAIVNVTTGCQETNCNGNWSLSKEFTYASSCSGVVIANATGLYEASSGSSLFAQNIFTNASLSPNDKINVTWYIWVT